MAHNIARYNGKDMVFTGRGIPAWHQLGTTIQGVATWKEAMELAGLNWKVEKRVLYDNKGHAVPAWGIFRTTDNTFLGVVGDKYKEIQNHQAFEFVDALIGQEGAHYDSAGALGKGEVIFCSAHLPSAGYEVVPGDKHDTFLLFKTSHDGSLSATCKLTTVRVVCQNTLNTALEGSNRIANGDSQIKIRHTKGGIDRLEIAKRLIANGKQTADAIRDKMRTLAGKVVTKESMEDILKRLFPISENGEVKIRTSNNIRDLLALYDSNDMNTFPEIRGTAYNLVNACVEYVDKYRGTKGFEHGAVEARATSALFGSGEKFKTDAFEYIYQAAKDMPNKAAAPMISVPKSVVVRTYEGKDMSAIDKLSEIVSF